MSTATIAHWEVTRAKNAGQKDNPHGGQLDKWYIGLKNLDGGSNCDDAYWQRKSPSEVTVGDKVFGKVEDGDYGDRFYLEKEEGYEATTGTSGASNNSPASSPPRRDIDASIARQVALKILSPWICEDKNFGSDHEAVVKDLERFILEAGQPKDEPPVDLSGARTEEPIPPKPSVNFHKDELPKGLDIDRDHIMQLLSSAGLVYAGAQEKVADYLMGPLTVEGRAQKALSGLQDLDRQGKVLAELRSGTEKWIGSPLDEGPKGVDDDIPFHHPEYREPGYERMRWRF